jgi:hypothetical protein
MYVDDSLLVSNSLEWTESANKRATWKQFRMTTDIGEA